MPTAAAGMHVEPSSQHCGDVVLADLEHGCDPVAGPSLSGFLVSSLQGELRGDHAWLVASAATAANHDLLWGELMTRGCALISPPCDLGRKPDVQRAGLAPTSIRALGAELTE